MKRGSGVPCGYVALTVLVMLSLTWLAAGSMYNNLHGIGHVSITTDDLDLSTRFYTEMLGGMVIDDLSYRYHGDEHYYLMFDKEITEAGIKGVDPSELGVPDISSNGTYEVRGNFIVFDNGLVQLQSFVRRGTNQAFEARENRTSTAIITAPHLCFLVKGDVDFHHYLVELEKISRARGFANVWAYPTVIVSTEEERRNLSEEHFGLRLTTGGYAGKSFAYVKGPSGEQLEFLQMTGESRKTFAKPYCRRKSVSPEFLTPYNDNTYKRQAGITGKLQGIIQVGSRSYDFELSTRFYTEILGGTFINPPPLGANIIGDDVYATLFLKEHLNALRRGVPTESLGIADISDSGWARFDLRFILFDNYVIESTQHTNGTSLLDDPPYNPRYNWSSSAYINSMAIAFQLDTTVDMDDYLQALEYRAKSEGFEHVRLNRCPPTMCRDPLFPTGSALEGYWYMYVKGPSGEQLVFTQFHGRAARILKQAFLAYGAQSTAFAETNPWRRDEFQPSWPYCTASRSAYSMILSIIILINVMIQY